ncbi:hypothetical protein QFC24_003497 [Naganishia onofrii]|uniref:Uncharacterized protein n=1 Tax=Naganishia onofrii TaxID=1851511 RepID=A0ACC2XJA8_9TREE|nr:hypothetical protein QFC24_003497 [Naganishia onofrii]
MDSGPPSPRGRKRDRLGNEKSLGTLSPGSGSGARTPNATRRPPPLEDEEPRYVGDPSYLEDFRKTQIYLQLLAYRRQAHRATSLYEQQSEKLQIAEGNARALVGMWQEVERSLRSQPEEPDANDSQMMEGINEAAIYTPHLQTVLTERFQSFRNVLGKIAPPPTPSVTAKLQAELVSLRTAHSALKTEYADISKKYEEAVEAREKSERYCDEVKLELCRAGGDINAIKKDDSRKPSPLPQNVTSENGNGQVEAGDEKPSVKQDPELARSNGAGPSTTPGPSMNGTTTPLDATTDIHHLLEYQSNELAALRAECLQLKKDKDEISAWVIAPTDEIIAQTPLYKALVEKFAENMVSYKTRSLRGEEAIEAANALRDDMERFRESALHEHRMEVESIRHQLRTKDADIARLRGQRDVLKEENDTRKAQQAVSNQSVKDVEEFAKLQGNRVKVLVAEAKRLRARLAALGGEQDYLGFLLQKEGSDLDYVRTIEEQLRQAKDREILLQGQISQFTVSIPEIEPIRQSLLAAQEDAVTWKRRFEHREALCSTSPEADLVRGNEEKAKQIQSLRLQVEQANTAVNSLYQEIDQLTQAYEGMQRMAESKIYNLKALETQVVDLTTVKAKAEHKFFAVSRENLGLKEQEAALKKSLDLQRSALEKAKAVEDSLHAQLSNQEKELTLLKTTIYKFESELQSLHTELVRSKAEVQAEEARMNAYKADAAKYMEAESRASAQCHELGEQILELRSKLKEVKSIAKTAESKVVTSSADPQLKRERDQLFVSEVFLVTCVSAFAK